jgi:pyruvate ferredoxin oxidoreductase alpha subunit
MHYDEARTIGGLAWPHEELSMRLEIDEAMKRVPDIYQECRQSFTEVFGRDPGDVLQTFATDDAEQILIASGTIATTARDVVRHRREAGEKIGLVKIKMFRPFPEAALREACRSAKCVGVLDRNYAAGTGGVFWQDTRAAFQGHRDDLLIQNYLTGLCGGDVTPAVIDEILTHLASLATAGDPIWIGIETGREARQ